MAAKESDQDVTETPNAVDDIEKKNDSIYKPILEQGEDAEVKGISSNL